MICDEGGRTVEEELGRTLLLDELLMALEELLLGVTLDLLETELVARAEEAEEAAAAD